MRWESHASWAALRHRLCRSDKSGRRGSALLCTLLLWCCLLPKKETQDSVLLLLCVFLTCYRLNQLAYSMNRRMLWTTGYTWYHTS